MRFLRGFQGCQRRGGFKAHPADFEVSGDRAYRAAEADGHEYFKKSKKYRWVSEIIKIFVCFILVYFTDGNGQVCAFVY